MTEKITQILTQQKVKVSTKINLVIGMVSVFFIGLAMFNNAFLLGPVGWKNSIIAQAPDTTPPTAVISSPTNNQKISGVFNITTALTDNTEVKKVEFYLDGKLRYTEHHPKTNWVYYWDTTKTFNGDHLFMIKVFDKAGNTILVDPVLVTINN